MPHCCDVFGEGTETRSPGRTVGYFGYSPKIMSFFCSIGRRAPLGATRGPVRIPASEPGNFMKRKRTDRVAYLGIEGAIGQKKP